MLVDFALDGVNLVNIKKHSADDRQRTVSSPCRVALIQF